MPNSGKWLLWGGVAVVGYFVLRSLSSSTSSTDAGGTTIVSTGSDVGSAASAVGNSATTASSDQLQASTGLTSDQYSGLLGQQTTAAFNLSNNANFESLVSDIYAKLATGVDVQRGFTQDFSAVLGSTSTGSPTIDIHSNITPVAPQQDLLDTISGLQTQLATGQAGSDSLSSQLAQSQASNSALTQQIASLQGQITGLQGKLNSAADNARAQQVAVSSQKTPNKSGVVESYNTILRALGF